MRFKVCDFCDSAKFAKFSFCEMLSRKQNKVDFERNCKIENTKSYISNEIAKFPSAKVPATQYVCT